MSGDGEKVYDEVSDLDSLTKVMEEYVLQIHHLNYENSKCGTQM